MLSQRILRFSTGVEEMVGKQWSFGDAIRRCLLTVSIDRQDAL